MGLWKSIVQPIERFTSSFLDTLTGNPKKKAKNRAYDARMAAYDKRQAEERRVQKEKDDAMLTEQERIKRNRTVFSSRKNRRRQGYGGMLRKKLGSD